MGNQHLDPALVSKLAQVRPEIMTTEALERRSRSRERSIARPSPATREGPCGPLKNRPTGGWFLSESKPGRLLAPCQSSAALYSAQQFNGSSTLEERISAE